MYYEVYELLKLISTSSTQIVAQLGIEQEFLEYYQISQYKLNSKLDPTDKLAIVTNQQTSFDVFQDYLKSIQKLNQMVKYNEKLDKHLIRLQLITNNFKSTIYEVQCRIERVQIKLAEFPLIFKPLQQSEASTIQNILKHELSFIDEKIKASKEQRQNAFNKWK
uniref:Uncharacterized protein n=1 Tax=Spironucleus salmonicida TaxID=348837 RepID=V6LSM5_9EUKA|eukprot:EST47243.1 Hypothetical protein SS50377_12753 [Spironucleus salmonicida]